MGRPGRRPTADPPCRLSSPAFADPARRQATRIAAHSDAVIGVTSGLKPRVIGVYGAIAAFALGQSDAARCSAAAQLATQYEGLVLFAGQKPYPTWRQALPPPDESRSRSARDGAGRRGVERRCSPSRADLSFVRSFSGIGFGVAALGLAGFLVTLTSRPAPPPKTAAPLCRPRRLRLRLWRPRLQIPPTRRSSPRSAFTARTAADPNRRSSAGQSRRRVAAEFGALLSSCSRRLAKRLRRRSVPCAVSAARIRRRSSTWRRPGTPRLATTNRPPSTTFRRIPCICRTACVWKPIRVSAIGSTTPVSWMSAITARRPRASINSRCGNLLFHGVQALRLNPIGAGFTFNRVGLLAHPYMLGPEWGFQRLRVLQEPTTSSCAPFKAAKSNGSRSWRTGREALARSGLSQA